MPEVSSKSVLKRLEAQLVPRPYKSTTHEEDFIHIPFEEPVGGISAVTIFLRKESDGTWYGADARCSEMDQFCRATGRKVARTRYFRDPDNRVNFGSTRPSYDEAWTEFIG